MPFSSRSTLPRAIRGDATLPVLLVLLAAVAMPGPVSATQSRSSVGRVVSEIQIGGSVPGAIYDGAFGFGSLWVSGGGDVVSRVNPATNSVAATIAVGAGFRHEIAAGNGAIWVSNPDDNTVSRIDPNTNSVVATISSGGFYPIGVATTPGAVWVANHHADPNDPGSTGSVARIDPLTNSIVTIVPVGAQAFSGGPGGMTATGSAVWVGVPNIGGVIRIDTATNAISGYVGAGPCGVPTSGFGSVWMPSAGCASPSGALSRIDAASATLGDTSNPGGVAWFAATGSGSVWASVTSLSCPPKCPPTSRALARIDPATGAVLGRVSLQGFGFVAYGAGSVWAGEGETGQVLRIDPD